MRHWVLISPLVKKCVSDPSLFLFCSPLSFSLTLWYMTPLPKWLLYLHRRTGAKVLAHRKYKENKEKQMQTWRGFCFVHEPTRDEDAKIITGGLWPSNRRGPSGFPNPRDRTFWRPQNPKCCGPAPSLWPSLFLPHSLCFDPDALASSLLIVNPNHDPTSGPLYLLLSGMFLTQALRGLLHCIWTSVHTSPHLFSEVPFSPTHHSLVIYSAIYCLSFLNKAYPHVTCAYLYYLEYKFHEEKTLLYSLLIPQGLEVYPAHAVPSIFVLMWRQSQCLSTQTLFSQKHFEVFSSWLISPPVGKWVTGDGNVHWFEKRGFVQRLWCTTLQTHHLHKVTKGYCVKGELWVPSHPELLWSEARPPRWRQERRWVVCVCFPHTTTVAHC